MEKDRCELDDVGENNHRGGEGFKTVSWLDSLKGLFVRLRTDTAGC